MHVPQDSMWRGILKSFWFWGELNKTLVSLWLDNNYQILLETEVLQCQNKKNRSKALFSSSIFFVLDTVALLSNYRLIILKRFISQFINKLWATRFDMTWQRILIFFFLFLGEPKQGHSTQAPPFLPSDCPLEPAGWSERCARHVTAAGGLGLDWHGTCKCSAAAVHWFGFPSAGAAGYSYTLVACQCQLGDSRWGAARGNAWATSTCRPTPTHPHPRGSGDSGLV